MFKLIAIGLIIITFKNYPYWSLFDPGSQYHPSDSNISEAVTLLGFQWNSWNAQFLSYGCNWHLLLWAGNWNHGLFGQFSVLQQMPVLVRSKGEHCKLEPSLPTKTIQEASPLFPSQLLGIDTAVRQKGQFPLCSTLQFLVSVQLLRLPLVHFQTALNWLFQVYSCFWSMEWALDFRSL